MVDSQLFLVRIWQRPGGHFLASVRRVDEEESRHFWAPDQLALFLARAVPGPVPPAPDCNP